MRPPRPRCVFRFRGLGSALLALLLSLGTALADTARVVATSANLRAAPGVSGRLVASLPRGTQVEVLGSQGDWLKVRVPASGAEGFILKRLVETVAPAPPPPVAKAPVTPPSPPAAPPVQIAHDDVACVVAGQHPKLLACFNPEENLGRARVLFRAAGTDPWYYVDMSKEGTCHAAILPKPRPKTPAFQYYVHSLDRGFFQVQAPETAPDQAFAPRVVKKQAECGGRKVALFVGKLLKPVKVGVALDPSGGALAAAAVGQPVQMPLTGFSTEGVELANAGTAPTRSGESSSGGGSQAGGLPKAALIGGGLAVAAVGVAVAAGGGGSSSSSGSGGSGSGGGSGGSGSGGGGGTGGALNVSGVWTGLAAQGTGLKYQFSDSGVSCSFGYDVTLNLTQSGSAASGTAGIGAQTISCNFPAQVQAIVNEVLLTVPRSNNSYPATGTANEGGAVTLTIGGYPFSGTYTRTNMDLTATTASAPGISQFSMTMRVTRAP